MPVESLHPDVETWLPVWQKNMDAYLGDRVIRFGDNQQIYLPKLTSTQTPTDYQTYKGRSYFIEATSRSVDGLVGVALWKDSLIELPDYLDGFITDEEPKEILTELYQTGRYGILVDMEQDENSNMIMAIYSATNIINYRLFPDGTFKWVVLKETIDGSDEEDKYIQNPVVVYRELRINDNGAYEQVLHKPDEEGVYHEDKDTLIIPLKSGAPLDEIPFRIYNPIKASTNIEPPPITGIVNSNIAYYQIYTEIRHKYHWSAIIQIIIFGASEDEAKGLKLGGPKAWGIKNTDGTAEVLETSGNGFEAIRLGLKGETDTMASLGARLLEPQKQAAEATETVKLRQTAEVATTSSIVGTVEGSIQWAIELAAEWKGNTINNINEVFKMSRDFFTSKMTPEEIREYTASWLAGALDDANLYLNFKEGEVIKTDITQEEFIELMNKKRESLSEELEIDDEE